MGTTRVALKRFFPKLSINIILFKLSIAPLHPGERLTHAVTSGRCDVSFLSNSEKKQDFHKMIFVISPELSLGKTFQRDAGGAHPLAESELDSCFRSSLGSFIFFLCTKERRVLFPASRGVFVGYSF